MAERMGQLWKREERGWIEQRRGKWYAASVVMCGYCGENRVKGGNNFVQMSCVHDMWCAECEPYKERSNKEAVQGRKFKNGCDECGRKWVGALKYKGICRICHAEGEKKKEVPKKEEERVLRHTMQPLREVWMRIGMEKINTHEGVMVKALLDSGATGMFVDKRFAKKNGFKMEKLERLLKVINVDGSNNNGGDITHEVECNIYYKGHQERMKFNVCNLGRTEVILDMPWLVAHNPEIDWEKGKVKMTRCPPWCGKDNRNRRAKEREEKVKRKETRKIEEKRAINWAADKKED